MFLLRAGALGKDPEAGGRSSLGTQSTFNLSIFGFVLWGLDMGISIALFCLSFSFLTCDCSYDGSCARVQYGANNDPEMYLFVFKLTGVVTDHSQ